MINQIQLAREVKKELPEMLVKDIDAILTVAFEKIVDSVNNGESVRIKNFAAIEPSKRISHYGVDPRNPQEKIYVPEVRTIRFRPCTSWRNEINGRTADDNN